MNFRNIANDGTDLKTILYAVTEDSASIERVCSIRALFALILPYSPKSITHPKR